MIDYYNNDRIVKRRFLPFKTKDGKIRVVDLWRIHYTKFDIEYNDLNTMEKYNLEFEIRDIKCIKRAV